MTGIGQELQVALAWELLPLIDQNGIIGDRPLFLCYFQSDSVGLEAGIDTYT